MAANNDSQLRGFATRAIHAGQNPERWASRCVIPAIVTSSNFKQDEPGVHKGFNYSRSGNPTRAVLEECIASLDNGKYGLCYSSGLGVVTSVISLLSHGDHVICEQDMYGGSKRLFRDMETRMGINVSFIDLQNADSINNFITPKTKMVYIETPTNPLLRVSDIRKISSHVKKHPDIIFAVENTFMTSYFQRPLELGADIVVYSMTKYMNGHADVIMGAAVVNREDLHERLRFVQRVMGIVPSPFDCYLVNRGLKTLPLRMKQHMKSSMEIAKWLEKHPFVEKVIYPGLPSHPQYELSKKQCNGYSGMMAIYIKGGLQHSITFLKSLKVFTLAGSLGDCRSLVALSAVMTHASVPKDEREKLGITDSFIRFSVGLEDVEDLIEDLDQALANAAKI